MIRLPRFSRPVRVFSIISVTAFVLILTMAIPALISLRTVQTQAALPAQGRDSLKVVATTGILADMTRNIAGDLAQVSALVPPGADPHSYEPSLANVRQIAYADLALSNHLLLEEQGLMRTVEANLPAQARHIQVAENASKYGAKLIPLVENASLNTIWLGMRVRSGKQPVDTVFAHPSNSQVQIQATGVTGPGNLSAYLTTTFGQPQVYINSADGFQADNKSAHKNHRSNTVSLPINAHTHMSWAFSKPGIYRLELAARLDNKQSETDMGSSVNTIKPLAKGQITFAVGVDPHTIADMADATVLSKGHLDIAVDLQEQQLYLFGDSRDGKPTDSRYDPAKTVIWVPQAALNQIPPDPAFRFLGRPGTDTYVLAQAVLGKHVHGEIDPHLWESVPNAVAYVKVIRDSLSQVDPAHAHIYADNAKRYLHTLDLLDAYIRTSLETIPSSGRQLVTTHDAYGYFGATYNFNIAGFITPNPGTEASAKDLVILSNTLRELKVKAVFLEPNAGAGAGQLRQLAHANGIKICTIYSDSFDHKIRSYVELMAANAYNLKTCLDPDNAPPPVFSSASASFGAIVPETKHLPRKGSLARFPGHDNDTVGGRNIVTKPLPYNYAHSLTCLESERKPFCV